MKVLYGRRAAADFVDLVRFALEPPRPRWLERTHIADLLAHLTPRSKTVVRLRLMHWTGMRPSQMARLQPEDFRLGEPTPFVVVPRGKGGRLVAIPLVGEGLATAREFMATWAYGRWSCPSANKALERAARKAGRPAFTVYQIRHAFATGLRRTGSDVADIQDLYGHTDPETTMIYAPPQLQKHAAAIALGACGPSASANSPGVSASRNACQRSADFCNLLILKDARHSSVCVERRPRTSHTAVRGREGT